MQNIAIAAQVTVLVGMVAWFAIPALINYIAHRGEERSEQRKACSARMRHGLHNYAKTKLKEHARAELER